MSNTIDNTSTNTSAPGLSADKQALHQQLEDMQHQMAFQEDALQHLNAALAQQQQEILILRRQVELLKQRQDELVPTDDAAAGGGAQQERPPHY
tara:strand:- start:74631 stop:74912 length:282 start_codon:yes stop_codon:yes gene_type:complete